MFDNVDDIYNHIGEAMFNALPDSWDEAWIEVVLYEVDKHIQLVQGFINKGVVDYFSVNKINGDYVSSGCDKAFFDLYKAMQKNDSDIPWNKAKFYLDQEGEFEIDFKFDEDFDYYKTLKPNSEDYKKLDIEVEKKILTWDGLSKDTPRFWNELKS